MRPKRLRRFGPTRAEPRGHGLKALAPPLLAEIIAEFVAFQGPAFLEVIINPDAGVYPVVGPGMSYAEMITGDWIASREPLTKSLKVDVTKTEMF